MRLLLDEQVPRVFADTLVDAVTTRQMGWSGVGNGELLRRAADDGFDAVLTIDKGIEFQQNLADLPISVLLVRAPSNRSRPVKET